MVVSPCDGSIDQRERLLPYVDIYVLKVDLDNNQMLVDWDPDF
jgi:16S rRNA processing protein RimM